MSDDKPPTTIHEALSRAKIRIGVIGKDDENQHHHYAFRGIDAIVNRVGPIFAELGIVTAPEHKLVTSEEVLSSGSSKGYRVIIESVWTFSIATEDADCELKAQTLGEAIDYSDKAINQAQRQSEKNALIQVLQIPTGETDPDSVSPDTVRELKPGEQILEALTAEKINQTSARRYVKAAMAELGLKNPIDQDDVEGIVEEALRLRDEAEAPMEEAETDEGYGS